MEWTGNNLILNRAAFEPVLARRADWPSELTTIDFNTERIRTVSRTWQAMFLAPGTIVMADNAYKLDRSHYRLMHETVHEADHDPHTAFGMLSGAVSVTALEDVARTFYSPWISASLIRSEGIATLYGMMLGGFPWAIRSLIPEAYYGMIADHRENGGTWPIDHPEYQTGIRRYTYQPGTEPYIGRHARARDLLKWGGWDRYTLIKYWHLGPFGKRVRSIHQFEVRSIPNLTAKNIYVDHGDAIIRDVEPSIDP